MITPGGYTMSVAMTNCGRLGWVSDRTGYRYTPRRFTNSRPENHFSVNRHLPRRGNSSCQGRTSFDSGHLMKVTEPAPRCFQQRGSLPPS
jgi:alkylated DNA repair dioxygenase AlkB